MKKLILIFILLANPAWSICNEKETVTLRGWVWHNALFQENADNRNAWGLRGTVNVALPCKIHLVGRVDGNILPNPENPGFESAELSSFKTAEVYLGTYWNFFRNYGIAGVVGQAFAVESNTVGNPQPLIAGGGLRIGVNDNYVYLLVGINEAVAKDQPIFMLTAAYELGKGVSIVADIAISLRDREFNRNYTRAGVAYSLPF